MTTQRIYLDHSATTPMRPDVWDAMQPYALAQFGNPSSLHSFGQEVKCAIETARTSLMSMLGATSAHDIVMTSSGTEADNLAIKGVAWANQHRGKHIITTAIEHHAVLHSCQFLEEHGFEVTYLPVSSQGVVDPAVLKAALRHDTMLVSIMHANNEVGVLQPIKEIGAIIAEANADRWETPIYFHVDAVQTAGKYPINVRDLNVDLLSISAHKFYGPKGVGALYIKSGTHIAPQIHGGGHEFEKRAGTENAPGIIGMAHALERAIRDQMHHQRHLELLGQRFEDAIKKMVPRVTINGAGAPRLPGVSNISFEAIEGEALQATLDMYGIAVSTGSACASGSDEPSHVLAAMGVAAPIARSSIRFSMGHENTDAEISQVVKTVVETVARLRAMSPLWQSF